eukprot:3460195-Rhodomonas_salina.1
MALSVINNNDICGLAAPYAASVIMPGSEFRELREPESPSIVLLWVTVRDPEEPLQELAASDSALQPARDDNSTVSREEASLQLRQRAQKLGAISYEPPVPPTEHQLRAKMYKSWSNGAQVQMDAEIQLLSDAQLGRVLAHHHFVFKLPPDWAPADWRSTGSKGTFYLDYDVLEPTEQVGEPLQLPVLKPRLSKKQIGAGLRETYRFHYHIKCDGATGQVTNCKVCLVIMGNRMKEGEDYYDEFAQMQHATSECVIISIAAADDLGLHSCYLAQAFIQADKLTRKSTAWCSLPRAATKIPMWSSRASRLPDLRTQFGCVRQAFEGTVKGNVSTYLGAELIRDRIMINKTITFKQSVSHGKSCKSIMLGTSRQSRHCLRLFLVARLALRKKAEELLFHSCPVLGECNLSGCTGHLSFLVTMTHCDLAFAYAELSKFIQCQGAVHLKEAERVLQYLRGTYDLGLMNGTPAPG